MSNCSGDVDPGYWSAEGATSAQNRKCFPGRYSALPGSTSAECQGSCLPGYYCPPGSISSSQKHCGSAKVFALRVVAVRPLRQEVITL